MFEDNCQCRAKWLCLCAALLPGIAFSQQPLLASHEPIAEIIVTARKIRESVQDIPMSVQVLPAELLDELDLTRLFDLQFNVPGLVVNNLGLNGAGFSLRGVGDQGGSSLSVATHLNGVYLGKSNLAITRMFDLERVEILRGPQGTLYGRNATGGSINFHTRRPQDEFTADIEAGYGSFATARVQGHVNVPLEKVAIRIAYIASEGDGFIHNSVDNRRFAEDDFWGLRGSLSVNLTDRLQLDFMAQHVEDDGASGELWLPNPDYMPNPSNIHLTTVTLPNPFLKTDSNNVSLNVEYDAGFAVLRSVTGYATNNVRDLDDCAGLPILLGCVRSAIPARHDQWSQEVQLVSPQSNSFDWILGSYYYGDDDDKHSFQFTPVLSSEPTNDRFTQGSETNLAVFAQASWHFARRWNVTGGLRLNREKHRLSAIGTGVEDSPTLVAKTLDGRNASWRLDLEFAASDDVLLYAGVATGFKSGGLTILSFGVLDPFDPEELTAYEAGVKSQWLDQRFTLNGAAFFYDFQDMQVSTYTATESGLIFETDNAARAEIYGIDTDALLAVSDRLTLSAGVVWLPKREFVEYRNDRTGDTLSGNKLARAPEWTTIAAISYNRPLASAGTLSARFEYNYRSGFFYTTNNNPDYSQDGFGLLNVFLKFQAKSGKWYAFATGRNLGDADYFNQVFLQASPGYPDTYEAGFGYRF